MVWYSIMKMIQWQWYLLNIGCRIKTITFRTTNHETTVSMVRLRCVTGLVRSINTYILVPCVNHNFTASDKSQTNQRAIWLLTQDYY
jgi:hypothetical protein